MDLSTFDGSAQASEGRKIDVLNPKTKQPVFTADGKPLTVTLLGRYSDEVQKVQRAIQNRRLAQRGNRAKVTAEEIEAETTEILSAAIIGFENIVVDGQTLDCTPASKRKLLDDKRFMWLREQIDGEVNDDAAFFSDNSKKS